MNLIFDYDGTLHNCLKIYAPSFRKAFAWLTDNGYAEAKSYTDEEIAQAKIDADKDLGMVKDQLASFMTAFLTVDKDNKNDYFDGTKLIEAPLVARVSNIVTSMAEEELISRCQDFHHSGNHKTDLQHVRRRDAQYCQRLCRCRYCFL